MKPVLRVTNGTLVMVAQTFAAICWYIWMVCAEQGIRGTTKESCRLMLYPFPFLENLPGLESAIKKSPFPHLFPKSSTGALDMVSREYIQILLFIGALVDRITPYALGLQVIAETKTMNAISTLLVAALRKIKILGPSAKQKKQEWIKNYYQKNHDAKVQKKPQIVPYFQSEALMAKELDKFAKPKEWKGDEPEILYERSKNRVSPFTKKILELRGYFIEVAPEVQSPRRSHSKITSVSKQSKKHQAIAGMNESAIPPSNPPEQDIMLKLSQEHAIKLRLAQEQAQKEQTKLKKQELQKPKKHKGSVPQRPTF